MMMMMMMEVVMVIVVMVMMMIMVLAVVRYNAYSNIYGSRRGFWPFLVR